jgi:hypothetical protein
MKVNSPRILGVLSEKQTLVVDLAALNGLNSAFILILHFTFTLNFDRNCAPLVLESVVPTDLTKAVHPHSKFCVLKQKEVNKLENEQERGC